ESTEAETPSSVDQESDLTQSTPPTKKITFSFAREALQAISPRAYTLQLSAMTSLEDVQSFIEEYDLENKVRIYPTLRNDRKWFIITYQDYPTIQVARDAVSSLP
ncbi:SPOR domain-containing protein, partial [Vibrio sp. 10N.222.55.E8]